MAKISQPQCVKLISGIIAGSEQLLGQAVDALEENFGQIDLKSDIFDFSRTNYYEAEMGSHLLRQFVAFAQPVCPDVLAGVKVTTNGLEDKFAAQSDLPRPVNIDPGYVALSKLVLASMKDFSHRIYLGQGVFGEITLQYRVKAGWQKLDWTFPDYASGDYFDFLTQARDSLHEHINATKLCKGSI